MPSYSTLPDMDLVALLNEGDKSAFTEIYNRYWKKLFVVASYRLNCLEDAEEVVQHIFTSLWQRRETLALSSNLHNYLSISVKYRVIKMLNKYYHHQQYIRQLIPNELDDSTQQTIAFDELKEVLEQYISELPEKCRLVFQLSREQGYTQKQIAMELRISEKTVEGHLGKAYKSLRSKLAHFLYTLL